MIQTGIESRVKVQDLIEGQLPEFILDESPKAVDFLKQYYISQEYQGGPTDLIDNLDQYLTLENLTPESIVGFTSLTSAAPSSDTTISVESTKGFPQSYGLLKIGDEIITYTGVTTNTFTGCKRGFSGITTYHDVNNPSDITFSTSSAENHDNYSPVQNLSSLFLKEFYKKLKYSVTPGLENTEFVSNVNVGNFIKEARTFYQAKGTEESFKILYKVLYGVTPKIVDLEQFLLKPSSAEYIRREVILVERISGDVNNLIGQTVYSSASPGTKAAVSEVEIVTRDNQTFYKIGLFIGYSDQDLIEGNFTVTANTKVLSPRVIAGSRVITVDSTIGFPQSGKITTGLTTVTYTDKTSNQFLGCTVVDNIEPKTEVRSDETIFGYENGDITKKVELKVYSIVSDISLAKDAGLALPNESVKVLYLGDLIDNPDNINDKTYKQKFANSWTYNTASTFEVSGINTSAKVYTLSSDLDKSSIKVDDTFEIINNVSKEVQLGDARVSSIDRVNKQVTLSYTGFSTDPNIPHVIRRVAKKTNSDRVPLEYGDDTLTSDVQNVYSESGSDFMYVASNSLPSFSFRKNSSLYGFKSISVGTGITFIGAATTENGALQREVTDVDYSIISFPTAVPFLTGDAVVYQPETTSIIGLNTGETYYTKVLSDPKQIKLYPAPSFIDTDNYLKFTPLRLGVGGKHTFTIESSNNKTIQPQKLLRKFPLKEEIKQNNGEPHDQEMLGMLVNGVEIKSYKSPDKVFYGPLSKIDVLNPGTGYDVINPPQIVVADSPGAGTTALVRPVISGSVEKIFVDPQQRELENVVSVSIAGGNGSGAILKPITETTFKEINFDARLLSNFGGVGEVAETITFLSDHNFRDGEEIIYKTNGNSPLSIGTFFASNADQNRFLVNNTKYIAEFINDKTIRLYNSTSDFNAGINTIGFTTASNSGIHAFRTFEGKKTLKEIRVLESGSGYQNRHLYVKPVGISTIENTVTFINHNFKEGDLVDYQTTGTAVSGLTTANQYYIFKVDDDTFRVADAGIGGTIKTNYNRNKFIHFDSVGSGYQIFKYPDIAVTVNVSYGSTNVGVITATPIVRGGIVDSYLYESGTAYGSSTINFEKRPSITIKNGKAASLYPVVLAGKVVRVDVRSRGSEYFSTPDVDVVVSGSTGVGAVLRPIIVNGQIDDVVVINQGTGYVQEETSITITPAGRNANYSTNLSYLTVNDAERFGSEYLNPTFGKGLQYSNISYSRDLAAFEFNDDGTSHSPIIGWAYDGNPIYGPYGYNDPLDQNSGKRILKSGYILDAASVASRPLGFTNGFFVEDYRFDESGDLDRHNGRFCKTPDFPNGTYAYFAGIATGGLFTPTFPYFIGDRFKSLYQGVDLGQDDGIDNNDLVRNTFPYKIKDDYASNDYLNESLQQNKQEAIITSTEKGSIDSIEIRTRGDNYKVGDLLNFDNSDTGGGGARATISSVEGKSIISIASSTLEYSESIITRESNDQVAIHIQPTHALVVNDVVSISGLSTFLPNLTGLKTVGINTDTFNIYKDIPANASAGLVTDVYISNIPNSLSIGSTIGIGTELLSVLNIFPVPKIVRVKRGITGTAHTTSTSGFVYPNRIFVDAQTGYFNSSLNEKIYFNPHQSVGVGSTSGVGIAVTNTLGDVTKEINIPTRSIYLPNHPFLTGQTAILRKNGGGSNISVANTETETQFDILSGGSETVYTIKKGPDFIGIVTQIGLTTSSSGLFFFNNGSDNYEYSIEPTEDQITCIVQKNDAVVSVSTIHNLQPKDKINLSVTPDRSVGIGTSTSVVVKFNNDIQKIVIDPVGFTSESIDIAKNTITLTNHNFTTGEKVYYDSRDLITSGLETGVYYVHKIDKDKIKLCDTFDDTLASPPVVVSLASTGGSFQELSAVNPKITPTKGNDLVFDLSDASLDGFEFKIYKDFEFNNEFVSIANTTTFSTAGVGTVGVGSTASLTLKYSEQLQNPLFYNVERSGFISTADATVKDFNQILYKKSKYDGSYSIIGVAETTFVITLTDIPEFDSYSTNNTTSMKYTTTSSSASGPVGTINIISEGSAYRSLPAISSITSTDGSDALLFPKSTKLGNLKQFRIGQQIIEFNTDKTLSPKAALPATIELKDNLTIDEIEILDGGSNYTIAPDLVIVDSTTGIEQDGILLCEIGSSSIDNVSIFEQPTGLTFNPKTIFAVNNTNGVGIATMQSSLSGIVTCFLTTPLLGFSTSVFAIGDEVFVEGVTKNGTDGTGFNSDDYGYSYLTVLSYSNTIPAKVEYSVAGLTTNPGLADTTQSSFANITKRSDLPVFRVTQKKSEFSVGENITVNGETTDLFISSILKDYIKVTGVFQLNVGDIIRGNISGSKGTVSSLNTSDGRFTVDYSVRSDQGWKTNTGELNNDIQVTPDNDYYQNLSYSIKSPIQYKDSIDSINRLVHTSGLKNFVETELSSTSSISVGSTSPTALNFIDLSSDNRVDTIYGFGLSRDTEVSALNAFTNSSRFIELGNIKLVDSLICRTNRVLEIDDVSGQFTNKENVIDEFIDLNEYTKNVARFLVQIRSTDGLQTAIYELIVLWNELEENVLTLNKAYLSSTGVGVTYSGVDSSELTNLWDEREFATVTGNIDVFDVLSVRFTPKDVFNIDYDIKFIKDTFNSNAVGLASTSIGLIKNQSSYRIAGAGGTATLFEYDAADFDAVHVQTHIYDETYNVQNFLEMYLHHDGTDTYITDYYFDSNPSEGISGNDFTNFIPELSGGVLSLKYVNTGSNDIEVKTNAVGFGATSNGISTLRFQSTGVPDGSERSAYYESNYAVGTGVTEIFRGSKQLFTSVKSLVSVNNGSDFALHQVYSINSDETNTFSTQAPFISIGSTTGIGTFGSDFDGSDFIVKFFPNADASGIVTVKAFNEALYELVDLENEYENIDYGFIKKQELGIALYDAVNSPRINKNEFEMEYQGIPIFKKTFNPADTTILDRTTGIFTIENHFFSDGEELIYRAGSTVVGINSSSIGIGATADSVGVVTNALPYRVWCDKITPNTFRLSTRPEYVSAGIYVTFTNAGEGNAHSLEMVKKNEKTIFALDDLIQAPLAYTPIVYDLQGNGGSISAASTVFALSGIASIVNGDILQIEDEYMKVGGVGLGTTSIGPISTGDINLVEVVRGFVGTAATDHTEPTTARVYRGSYNISGNRVFFTDPPKGSGLVTLNDSGLPRPFSKFSGRTYLRQSYENNLVYDDISRQFTGIAQTFVVQNTGVNTTGIETGSGLVLLNGIFQTPTTNNNAGNNFTYGEVAGVSSITFTGITSTDGSQVTSISDVNQNGFPRGGLIVSLGSTNGLGFAPLVGADILPTVTGGVITGVVGVPTYGQSLGLDTCSYNNESGILEVTTATAHNLKDHNQQVWLEGLEFSCAAPHAGVTTTIFPDGTLGNVFAISGIVSTTTFNVNVGTSTIPHTYMGSGSAYPYFSRLNVGSGYNGLTGIGISVYEASHTGAAATITAVVGAGGTLTFTVEGGGSGYTNPDILVDAPSYSNLEIEGTFRRGIGSTTTTGVNLLMSVELGPNSQSIYADRYADAAALLEDNKTFIAEMAVGRMLDAYPSFTIPTGNQACIDDAVDVVEAISYNLRFGGNDATYDAATLYISGAHVAGEEDESIYVFNEVGYLANNVINNVAIAKSGYTSEDQVFDFSITADPLTGFNTSPSSCADVQSSITSFVGIVTNAIGLSTIPGSRTIAPASLYEVAKFSIDRQGYAFEPGDKFKPIGLVTALGLTSPSEEFELEVTDVYYDTFSSWQFGQLDFIDPIKVLQNGTRSVFPMYYNAELVSFEKDPLDQDSALIDMDSVLLVFINGVLQEPKSAYQFDGGSSIQFITPPKPEDNISIFFYQGTRNVDATNLDINETIKPGDSVFLNRFPGITTSVDQREKRIVYSIPSAQRLQTNVYSDVGIDEVNFRNLDWTKQKRDLFVNGDYIYKSRDSLEGMVYPTAKIIANVNPSDTAIFVDNAQFFNYEENESSVVTPSVDAFLTDDITVSPAVLTATVTSTGRVSGVTIVDGGAGYASTLTSINLSFSAPKFIGVGIGTTATATATITNGSVSGVTLINPGLGYTNSQNVAIRPQVIAEQPKNDDELLTEISVVQGNTGIITGIKGVNGIGTDLAIKFYTDNTTDLQVGYYILVTGTNVGSGVTSIFTHNDDIIGIGTEYLDNVYRVDDIPVLNEIVCNIDNRTVTSGIETLGTSVYNPNGYFSWGRLSSITRDSSNPISIGVTGRTVSGLSTYPILQRKGYGLRDNGAIRKILPD